MCGEPVKRQGRHGSAKGSAQCTKSAVRDEDKDGGEWTIY